MNRHLVVGSWRELGEQAAQVRFVVFIEEQKVPAELELDELDVECVHALIEVEGKAVATGRLCPDGRIGRIAVLRDFRALGLGGEIMQALISAAEQRGQHETYLHAQCRALGFYAQHGYVAEGPEFDEAGIPHRQMRRIA